MKRTSAPIWRQWRRAEPALPALATLLAVVAVAAGAIWRGALIQPSVFGVFAVIGVVATLVTRQAPWRGALFVLGLTAVVVGVLYVV